MTLPVDKHLIRFVLSFSAVSVFLFLYMYLNQQLVISRPVNTFTAHSVKIIADIFGFDSVIAQRENIRVRGNEKISVPTTLLSIGDFQARIILECSAVHAGLLLLAFLLTYPSTVIQKIQGILFLSPVLFIFNAVRIFILMLIGHYFGPAGYIYNIFHIYVMRFLMIALVLILALVWLRWVTSKKQDYVVWFLLRFILISGIVISGWYFLKHVSGVKPGFIVSSVYPVFLYISLALANLSSYKHMQMNYKEFLLGLGIMMVFFGLLQFVYQTVDFRSANSELLFVMVNTTFKYILPFGLFFLVVRNDLFAETRTSGNSVSCPICGEEKVGIVSHISAKHGDKSLADPKIQAFLRKSGISC